MSLQPQNWEPKLLSLAYEDLGPATSTGSKTVFNRTLLDKGYRYCKNVTARHSRSSVSTNSKEY